MLADLPPTILIVHPREKRSKCTIRFLQGRPEFVFYKHPRVPAIPTRYIRLGLGGPVLTERDCDSGLLLLDGTWRWAAHMEGPVQHLEVRSLPPIETAYPRNSKVFANPDGGLATIEALYAALKILGRDVTGLLDDYLWRDEFLQKNPWLGTPATTSKTDHEKLP